MKLAVFGATGPVGRQVTRALLYRGIDVRVVSRSPANLERDFGGLPVERRAADLEERTAAAAAARGCERVIHAVGLPPERFERHVPIAENAVAACREAGARALLVTSYWSYGPGDDAPMAESRPLATGSGKAAIRAREERIFLDAGGAVARLPDLYGPERGLSLLNDALDSVRRGKAASWPGDPAAPRDFLDYRDAGRLVVQLALRDAAYGEAWNVPGSGPESPRAILERAAAVAGTTARVRRIRPWMARLAALVRPDVRAILDFLPLYEAPLILDAAKLEGLLGEIHTKPYEEAVPETLAWLAEREAAAAEG